jgi:hypothetical protein
MGYHGIGTEVVPALDKIPTRELQKVTGLPCSAIKDIKASQSRTASPKTKSLLASIVRRLDLYKPLFAKSLTHRTLLLAGCEAGKFEGALEELSGESDGGRPGRGRVVVGFVIRAAGVIKIAGGA